MHRTLEESDMLHSAKLCARLYKFDGKMSLTI